GLARREFAGGEIRHRRREGQSALAEAAAVAAVAGRARGFVDLRVALQLAGSRERDQGGEESTSELDAHDGGPAVRVIRRIVFWTRGRRRYLFSVCAKKRQSRFVHCDVLQPKYSGAQKENESRINYMRLQIISICAVVGLLGFAGSSTAQTRARAFEEMPSGYFLTSDQCIACHSNLHSSSGEDVSIGYNWRASMMANSARDPYWHAGVRREVIDHPEAQTVIEDTCSTCHMPMSRFEAS